MNLRRSKTDYLKLDESPTGLEEWEDFLVPDKLSGESYDTEAAKGRIDALARRLALVWTIFLIWLVVGQGTDGIEVWPGWTIIPNIELGSAEFIAVITTTTATVFGLLLIVARHLFSGKTKPDEDG